MTATGNVTKIMSPVGAVEDQNWHNCQQVTMFIKLILFCFTSITKAEGNVN